VSKVKKVSRRAGVRNVAVAKSVKSTRTKTKQRQPSKKVRAKVPRKAPAKAHQKTRKASKVTKARAVPAPAVKFEIKELDPIRKCGPGTSVQILLRVIERRDGNATNHLVFFDKYGWYCDHGRSCAAVAHARKRFPSARQ
jgi:hypothetical protein